MAKIRAYKAVVKIKQNARSGFNSLSHALNPKSNMLVEDFFVSTPTLSPVMIKTPQVELQKINLLEGIKSRIDFKPKTPKINTKEELASYLQSLNDKDGQPLFFNHKGMTDSRLAFILKNIRHPMQAQMHADLASELVLRGKTAKIFDALYVVKTREQHKLAKKLIKRESFIEKDLIKTFSHNSFSSGQLNIANEHLNVNSIDDVSTLFEILDFAKFPQNIGLTKELLQNEKYEKDGYEFLGKILKNVTHQKRTSYTPKQIESYFEAYGNCSELNKDKFLSLLSVADTTGRSRFDDKTLKSMFDEIHVNNQAQITFLKENLAGSYCKDGPEFDNERIVEIMKRVKLKKSDDIDMAENLLYSGWSYEDINTALVRNTKHIPFLYANESFRPIAQKLDCYCTNSEIRDKLGNLSYLIEDGIKDKHIDAEIQKHLESFKTSVFSHSELRNKLDAATLLAEIEHSAKNKSYTLNGDTYEYTRLKKIAHTEELAKAEKIVVAGENKAEALNVVTGESPRINRQRNESPKSEHERMLGYIKDGREYSYPQAEFFRNEMELDSLKRYLENYSGDNSELSSHLYQKYYLPRLSPELKIVCKKIAKEFNTKLFVEDEMSSTAAHAIYDELKLWQKVSNGEFSNYPISVIDLSRFNSYYLKNADRPGFADTVVHTINSKSDLISNVQYCLRHEIWHIVENDGDASKMLKNGIDFSSIMVRKPDKSLGGKGDLIWDKCLYREEFLNAGISPRNIEYAYEDWFEFKARASEGDYSKYSDEFKEVLVKLGLKKWVFDLKVTNPEIIANANYMARLKQKYPQYVDLIYNYKLYNEAQSIKKVGEQSIPQDLLSDLKNSPRSAFITL